VPRAVEQSRDGEGRLGVDHARHPDQEDDRQGDGQADHPGEQRASSGSTGQLGHLDLVAGQQEEHPQPELAQDRDRVVGGGQAEAERSDQHPGDEQDHDLRHQPPRHQPGDQGSDHRAQGDPQQ
jgi:hypothetical protein